MEFSRVLRCGASVAPLYSHNGQLIAVGDKNKLIIRSADDLSTLWEKTCKDNIDYLEWSSDSLYLLSANFKRGLVEVWSTEDPEWSCRIDEGAAGLDSLRWAPDGRHVLTTAQHQIRITVWSLVSHSVFYFKYPKFATRGLSFSNDGSYMAVLERRQHRDFVAVVDCGQWKMLRQFEVQTNDAHDLSWSPDDQFICVWDPSLWYKVCVYTFLGDCVKEFSAYENALGIKRVQWSPSSQLLAIGSYDKSIRLLNNMTWTEIIELKHKSSISVDPKKVIYREVPMGTSESAARADISEATSKYEVCSETVSLPNLKLNPEKANPPLGIGWLRFSANSEFLASRTDNSPQVLYIWHISKLRLTAVLQHIHNLHDAAWHPTLPLLAICCGKNQIYFWSRAGTFVVRVPTQGRFSASVVKWSDDGDTILVSGKKGFCTCSCEDFASLA